MTPKEVEDYYQAWTEVGEVYEGGSYMEMFINSDAMLTDCCSFLGEYLPSGHPILHLISPDAKFNAFAESFIGTFYQIRNMEELKIEFERVIMNGDDYKKEERIAKTNILIDPEETATSKIMTDIRNTLKKG